MLDIIRRNPSTSITAFFAFLAFLIPFIAELRDATNPFNVPASVWVTIGTILAGGAVVGKMWQAIEPTVPVSWGWPSIVGFVGSAAALITPFLGELADTLEPFNVPADVYAKVGSGLMVLTLLGRIWQGTQGKKRGIEP